MRIAIDARSLQNEGTKVRGIGKYTEALLNELSFLTKKDEVLFLCNKGEPAPEIINKFQKHKTKMLPVRPLPKNKYLKVFASSLTPAKVAKSEADVFFQTDPNCGFVSNIPTLAVFHDLIPYLFRNNDRLPLYTPTGVKHLIVQKTVFKKYMQVLASYKKARAIAAISEASRQDYIKYLDAKAGNKVINIGGAQAITNNLVTTQDKRIIKKLKLQNVPYLFYIGGIDQRKNILQLLKDLKTLLPRNPNLKLVVAGKEFELIKVLDGLGWNSFLQENPNVKKSVVYAGFVTNGEATVLLKNACVFPFPSLYEGFGLPPLEAMHVGCPVVCYSNSSLPEVVGKAALIVKDGEPLAPAIQKILSSKKLGLELRQQGQEQAAKFTWKPVAEKVYNKLREIK